MNCSLCRIPLQPGSDATRHAIPETCISELARRQEAYAVLLATSNRALFTILDVLFPDVAQRLRDEFFQEVEPN